MKRFLFQFDAMCGGKETLGEKLGITPDSFKVQARPKTFFDDLSDDEERTL
jgi:hypothetical protein